MSCFKPISAIQPWGTNENGKRPLVFAKDILMRGVPKGLQMRVPCGRCIGCRLERSRVWALRCVHEASLYEDNCFITLTFDERYSKPSLEKSDFQNFMKRLRKRFPREKGNGIKFFHCGEYGDKNGRPHHHACLFNFRFPDLKPFVTPTGSTVMVSEILEKLWPFGYCFVGEVTFESAAYVARYVLKKWARANLHGEELYKAMLEFDKEKGTKLQEYVTMSRGGRTAKGKGGGIGYGWFEKYGDSDLYSKDFVTVRGVRCKIPKYYDLKKELTNPDFMIRLRHARKSRAMDNPDNTYIRLDVKRQVAELNASRLRREL